jgi:hypothetical protein
MYACYSYRQYDKLLLYDSHMNICAHVPIVSPLAKSHFINAAHMCMIQIRYNNMRSIGLQVCIRKVIFIICAQNLCYHQIHSDICTSCRGHPLDRSLDLLGMFCHHTDIHRVVEFAGCQWCSDLKLWGCKNISFWKNYFDVRFGGTGRHDAENYRCVTSCLWIYHRFFLSKVSLLC